MDKFKDKYRIDSNRLKAWDYGKNAHYFVSICTQDKSCFFGEIKEGKMILSAVGHIANLYWMEIPNHFPFVELGANIVMSNHVHGVITINKYDDVNGGTVDGDMGVETPKLDVSTVKMMQTANITNHTTAKNRTQNASKKWKPSVLGAIINQYKRVCTINARKINPNFAWQSNYHDHIIRNNKSYRNITNYIMSNPMKWQEDQFNPENPNSKNEGYQAIELCTAH